MRKIENTKCYICGANRKSNLINNKKWICRRHYEQIKKYGKPIDTSPLSLSDRNIITFKSNYAEIELQNKNHNIMGYALIDLNYVDLCKDFKWHLDTTGYACTNINKKRVRLHKFLTNTDNNIIIDHINGNKLDCRMNNLQIVTKRENTLKKRIQSNNKSGIIGVCWINPYKETNNGYWLARLKDENIEKHKLFKDKESAIIQRLFWELKYYQNFSPQLNLINSKYQILYNYLKEENLDDNTIHSIVSQV